MAKIKITCDSTCDLTEALYRRHQVQVLPLGIHVENRLCRDRVDIFPDQIFASVDKTGALPGTSAVSPEEYRQCFASYVEQGYEVVHINISSEMSSCHQNARLAAAEFEQVTAVDSRSLSSGSGLLVLAAAEMAESGLMSAAEIAEKLNTLKTKLDVSFVLQTLDYLKKGGRCSSLAALSAGMLQIRPEIEVVDGSMHVGKKFRGSAQKSIQSYLRNRLENRTDVDTSRAFVTHSLLPEDIAREAMALVRELQPFREVIESDAGCTVSSHCGPACLGVLFFTK